MAIDEITMNDFLEKSKDFLKAKGNFIIHRRRAIKNLQDFYEEWYSAGNKNFVVDFFDSLAGISSEISESDLLEGEKTTRLIKDSSLLLKVVSIKIKNLQESNIKKEKSRKFEIFLMDNKEVLENLDKSFDELYELIVKHELKILELKKTKMAKPNILRKNTLFTKLLMSILS